MDRLVVVGASLAGLRAAQAARAAGHTGELVVVGDEPHLPYTRPPLSKELLKGLHEPDQCALPHGTVEATWRLGTPATGLDRQAKVVRLADGDEVPYDRVILATGCRARPWPGAGADLAGVLALRSLDDALSLKAALQHQARLLVVGAGFVGCEVAASARALGCPVTVVDIAPEPMLPLGPELGRRCAALHREHGVDLRCATGIETLLGERRVTGARLTDGSTVEADVVLMALGAAPNTEWLQESGLDIGDGVACDATLTSTADPDVLVAGDVAAWPHPLAGGGRVRIEHWTTAAEHGQLAGRNALLDPDQRAPHVAPPYFWSDQYDLKIQAVGFPARAEQLEIVEQSPDGQRLVAVGAHAGQVVGVVAFNAARRLAFYRRQLASPPALEELRALVAADEKSLGDPVGAGIR